MQPTALKNPWPQPAKVRIDALNRTLLISADRAANRLLLRRFIRYGQFGQIVAIAGFQRDYELANKGSDIRYVYGDDVFSLGAYGVIRSGLTNTKVCVKANA
jgi:hypothetical protein